MSKLRKIMAILSVILIVGLVLLSFILGIMGSKYFLAALFFAIVVPIVLWVFMWFTHLTYGDSEEPLLDGDKEPEKGKGVGKPTP